MYVSNNKVVNFINNFLIEGVMTFQEFIVDDIILDGIYNYGDTFMKESNIDYIAINAREDYSKDNSSFSIEINLESFDIKSLKDDNNKIILSYLSNDSVKKYTLVIDLEDTLVHLSKRDSGEATVLFRPNLDYFLDNVSKYYEIVIFTCALQEYADSVIDKFDKGRVSHRLYRQHTIVKNNCCIKDLTRLGRNIEKVVIIDNLSYYYLDFPSNGLNILSFYGSSKDDNELKLIASDLIQMANKNLDDLRPDIKNIQLKLARRNQFQLEKLLK
jgi:Dullard-like phosphatase family protein